MGGDNDNDNARGIRKQQEIGLSVKEASELMKVISRFVAGTTESTGIVGGFADGIPRSVSILNGLPSSTAEKGEPRRAGAERPSSLKEKSQGDGAKSRKKKENETI